MIYMIYEFQITSAARRIDRRGQSTYGRGWDFGKTRELLAVSSAPGGLAGRWVARYSELAFPSVMPRTTRSQVADFGCETVLPLIVVIDLTLCGRNVARLVVAGPIADLDELP